MCPLRLILIFLSATLAGFFLIRNFKCTVSVTDDDNDSNNSLQSDSSSPSPSPSPSPSRLSKVRSVVESGFWTCVDMASGRYLWRHFVSSDSSSKRSS